MAAITVQLERLCLQQASELQRRSWSHDTIEFRNDDKDLSLYCSGRACHGATKLLRYVQSHHCLRLPYLVIGIETRIPFRFLELVEKLLARDPLVVAVWRGKQQFTKFVFDHAGGIRGVVAIVPIAVMYNRINLCLPQKQIVRRESRRTYNRNRFVHEIRIRDHPLKRLHAAH